MSYSHASRRSGGGQSTTLLAAKVAFASAALAAVASFARLAVPQLVSVAGAFLPRASAAVRFWSAPPCLLLTVHIIIFVIWKLDKHFQAQHKDLSAAPHPPHTVEEAATVIKPKEEFVAGAEYGKPLEPVSSPEFSPDSGGGESCVTTESDEDDSSTASYIADARRSLAPVQEHAVVLERELSPPPPAVAATAVDNDWDDDNDDDLDATWNAIMQKTRPAAQAEPPPQPPPPPRARDPSARAEELNKRIDDFIKKNHHSFGRQ